MTNFELYVTVGVDVTKWPREYFGYGIADATERCESLCVFECLECAWRSGLSELKSCGLW